jgi:glycogen operon protein
VFPQLQGRHWLVGRHRDGNYDVKWLTPKGTEMTEEDWAFAEAHYLSYVLAPMAPSGAPLFIVLNAAAEPVEFVLPHWPGIATWSRLLSTVADHHDRGGVKLRVGTKRMAPSHSVTAFAGAA